MYVDINTDVVNMTFIRIMRYGEFVKHCWSWLVLWLNHTKEIEIRVYQHQIINFNTYQSDISLSSQFVILFVRYKSCQLYHFFKFVKGITECIWRTEIKTLANKPTISVWAGAHGQLILAWVHRHNINRLVPLSVLQQPKKGRVLSSDSGQ